MTIASNGRISMGGTTRSANTLTLQGTNTELDITNTSTDGRNFRIASESTGILTIIDKTANVERVRVDSSGKVGVAVAPSDQFEVAGNLRANVSNGGGFMLTGSSASGLVRNNATGIALRTNTTDRFIIDNNGNSIFAGDVTISNNAARLLFEHSTGTDYEIKADGSIFQVRDTTENFPITIQQLFDGSTGSSNTFLATRLQLSAGAKTGWGDGDVHGEINFHNYDGSGAGARNAASIKAINTQGNGTSTTTFDGALAFFTSDYNSTETKAVEIQPSGVLCQKGKAKTASIVEDAKQFTAANSNGSSGTNTDVEFTLSDYGIGNAGYYDIIVSASGYGNAGSAGFNFRYQIGGYSGHTANSTFHRNTVITDATTNCGVAIRNPDQDTLGIRVFNQTAGNQTITGVISIKIVSTYN